MKMARTHASAHAHAGAEQFKYKLDFLSQLKRFPHIKQNDFTGKWGDTYNHIITVCLPAFCQQ